ncbi:uncharacterized protein LOC129776764 [Toxorhynchites rutilus septentrionalis]|uniref:uncharacterized protein LOC129776764 n=1 Tax=Toxorhynchites rutilus septentrionalis TaxID=329112 RepID=UPI00247AAE47|nr:uncharacterized protein LOC129776764 [Toxorhynchites rutilus septentrionalis]XP_055638575.1 uncharacterized protein LOC129776764 [Toxorhynchites rutilus septentrionalis]XP_055638576.1 uncharacterized protein LOC129776764 [Toxorhynchites rutilus septentrionalis]
MRLEDCNKISFPNLLVDNCQSTLDEIKHSVAAGKFDRFANKCIEHQDIRPSASANVCNRWNHIKINDAMDIPLQHNSHPNMVMFVDEGSTAKESIRSDGIHSSSKNMSVDRLSIREYYAIISRLQRFFRSSLNKKLERPKEFYVCIHCGHPINDVFDIAFVEQCHLICLFKIKFKSLQDEETIAKIQLLKINLFQSFKNNRVKFRLIKTCPQFRCFLESLRLEVDNANYTTALISKIKDAVELSVEKVSEQCPYCGLQMGNTKLMSYHQQNHERTIEFLGQEGQKTYLRLSVRMKHNEILQTRRESHRPNSFRCYMNKKKIVPKKW